jgi:hypothetical protein
MDVVSLSPLYLLPSQERYVNPPFFLFLFLGEFVFLGGLSLSICVGFLFA